MAAIAKKNQVKGLTLGAALAFLAATVGLSVPAIQAQGQRTIKIDGSSTVYPVTEAVAEEFQKANRGIQVTVGVSGTGGGFKKFCRGETDISNASRPISKTEIQECASKGIKYMELPIAYDALTVVVNTQNTWAKSLTVAELKKMWEPGAQGKINNWSQIRSGFPNAPLKLFGPGTASGTFDYFTEAIVGKSKSSRGDYTASEDDNVLVQGVTRDKNAIGYFGYAYYEENKGKLKAVPIDSGKGAVLPSTQAVQNGTYRPLSRPLFIYVNAKSADKPEVKQFVEFYLKNGAKLAREVKYVALPAVAYTTAMGHFTKRRVGTIFGGEEAVGLTIEELLKREAR
ncbi:MAG TPA: PstS family phosphate ABC transporter substrate-binding protein [Kamptonema sp.]|nr:PstS family phosphate ABC transporter substrate-binding protein [Kamptonema sp.]